MRETRILRGLLTVLFIAGYTVCLTGCGVDSGKRGGNPYGTPGSGGYDYTGGSGGGTSGGTGGG